MKHSIKNITLILLTVSFFLNSCKDKEYTMGSLTAPTNLVISTEVEGQDGTHPDGDGSGNVKITATADGALTYKVDYDANDAVDLVSVPSGSITKKYTKVGVNTYRITLVAYGKGGTSSTLTKDVTVRSDFEPDAAIVTSLTGTGSKAWRVNKDVPGHFGVGPFTGDGSTVPGWWAAGINEKVGCCNCFYTATFTFNKSGSNYTLDVATPDGAFTKTGALTTLPGIPASGDEACYSYGGGSSAFSFAPASSGITTSTQTSIQLAGSNTFIGYGALQKEYEILEISDTRMYLRVQGTETGNAWYIVLKPAN